eukprot:13244408-Alexandrium_andersonii.AAC.1
MCIRDRVKDALASRNGRGALDAGHLRTGDAEAWAHDRGDSVHVGRDARRPKQPRLRRGRGG